MFEVNFFEKKTEKLSSLFTNWYFSFLASFNSYLFFLNASLLYER